MKIVRLAVLTILVMLVEFGLSYFIANEWNMRLIDVMFFVGLLFSLFFIYFSSTGGITTNFVESSVALSFIGLTNNYKIKRTFGSLQINCFNLGSVLFLLVGFVVAFTI